MDLHLNLAGRRDLPGEVFRGIREAILDGRLQSGERLPATRQLASQLGLSRTTVAVAYERLIGEGYVVGRVGAGTFVSTNAVVSLTVPGQTTQALRPRPFWQTVPPAPPPVEQPVPYDFRTGIPDSRLFPYDTWRRLIGREIGPVPATGRLSGQLAGHRGLREAISRRLGVSRGVRTSPGDVVITSGTRQAVDLVARILLGPDDRVAVEDPGHPASRWPFAALGIRVTGVPVDGEGLIVDAIPPGSRLVYVTPSHQFPLGMSMSLARRMALIDWAQRHDAVIVEDDRDCEFVYSSAPLEALHTLDTTGRVIYVGSFSRTMLPTLRLGFVVVPASLREATRAAKNLTGAQTGLAFQAALARFIDDGLFASHVGRMRVVYQKRHDRIVEIMARTFADELEVVSSSVGVHLATIAREASTDRIAHVARVASTAGVECSTLSPFAISEPPKPGILLGYGAIAVDEIDAGLSRLRRCFDE
jgi:GntR family transcriptional regulator/MocR family aminotransferase